jgi:hypothetical protein
MDRSKVVYNLASTPASGRPLTRVLKGASGTASPVVDRPAVKANKFAKNADRSMTGDPVARANAVIAGRHGSFGLASAMVHTSIAEAQELNRVLRERNEALEKQNRKLQQEARQAPSNLVASKSVKNLKRRPNRPQTSYDYVKKNHNLLRGASCYLKIPDTDSQQIYQPSQSNLSDHSLPRSRSPSASFV